MYSTNKGYITPSVEVYSVNCEVGFQGTTGSQTFSNGTDDGFENL